MHIFASIYAVNSGITGLSWKKLQNSPAAVVDENEFSRSPITRSMSRGNREPLRENINRENPVNSGVKQDAQDGKKKAILRRVSSVRDAFGTLRQVRLCTNYCLCISFKVLTLILGKKFCEEIGLVTTFEEFRCLAVADPGFPVRGCVDPLGGHGPPTQALFAKKCV